MTTAIPSMQDVTTRSGFHDFCESMRRLHRDTSTDINMTAALVQRALSNVGRVDGGPDTVDSGERRRRARRVSRQLKLASMASFAAAKFMVKAYGVFEAEYPSNGNGGSPGRPHGGQFNLNR